LRDLERVRGFGWAALEGEVFVLTDLGTVVCILLSGGIGRALEGEFSKSLNTLHPKPSILNP